LAQGKDAGIEGLKLEMSDMPGVEAPEAPAPAAVAGDAETKPAPEAPVAPVLDDLTPAVPVAPDKVEEKPVVEEKPATPAIDDLAPAAPVAPAKVEEKPATPSVDDLAPAPVVPVAAEAEKTPEKAVAVPVVADPDVATKVALETAIKELGSPERIKIGTSVAQQEEVRRKVRELEGRKAMELADQAWKAGDYAAASEQYKLGVSKLRMVRSANNLRDRANARIPDCEYQIILAMAKDRSKTESAITTGEEYLKQRPNNPALRKLIGKLKEAQQPVVVDGSGTGEEARAGETEADKQMRMGKSFMANREYAKSRASFESVLAIEPENREAMRYLKVLGEREYNMRSVEREATVRKMEAEVRDTWNPKYKMIKGREVVKDDKGIKIGPNPIEEKMKKIVIDEIEFRQANMHDVVDFLNKRSREMDKTTDDETKKGVNIILNLGLTATAAPAKAAGGDDVFAAEADKGGGGASGVPEVTFSARYITLFNALKIITDVAGLRSRIDGDVVMIVPKDWTAETMEMRMYPVEPTFIERVKTASVEMPAANARVGGREATRIENAGGVGGETVPSDLKAYFENMGVKFPKGSSVNYSPAIGKVIVLNTADNLTAFEKILAELNVVPKQVEIEARFVEVNETDLYEAGLEWLLTDNWEMMMKNNPNPFAPASSNPRIQMNANSANGGVTKGLRFFGTDSESKQTLQGGGQGTLGSIASFASVLTNPDLTMVLHALEQNGNADLLSAPKVTTRSGTEATIKVVTEYIYPTTFEVQGGSLQANNGNNNNSAGIVQETTVVPQDFAMREVGVILNVLPEVSPDGNMINLTMKPSVVTEPIWYQYGSTVRRADGSTMQMNMPQPFFQLRNIETQISIYDGATVVMGGLITEAVEKANDKIPVLGDIPFIGALFRSKSEKSVKKNLLIFVTAKLVDPAGRLIRTQDQDLTKPAAAPAGGPAVAK
jgi:general secretion pathway protein D